MMDMERKADEAKASFHALDAVIVAPKIDTTSLDEADLKARRLAETLRSIGTMNLSICAPSVDQTIRGIHANPGIGRAR